MLQIMSRSGYRMQLQLYLILPNTTQSPNVTRLIQIFDTYLTKHIVGFVADYCGVTQVMSPSQQGFWGYLSQQGYMDL